MTKDYSIYAKVTFIVEAENYDDARQQADDLIKSGRLDFADVDFDVEEN